MRRRFPRQQWIDWIAQQADSGLSAASFCSQHDIPLHSFYLWRAKLTKADALPSAASSLFVPLSLPAGEALQVDLPCGATLRVPPQSVHQVLSTLLQLGEKR